MKELKHINHYFLKYKYHFFGGILITIIAQIFSLYTPELIGDSITEIEKYFKNHTANPKPIQYLLTTNIFWILTTTIIAGVLTFLMRQTLIVMSRHVEYDMKNDVFKKYTTLTQAFYKNNKTGDLMNRISEDIAKVRMYIGPAVMYTINTIIRFAVVLFYMIKVSPLLTIVVLVPLPLLAYFIFKLSTAINKKSTIFQQNLSQLTSFAQEYFSGIRIIKAYSIETSKEKTFSTISNAGYTKSVDLAKTQALFGPLMLLLIGMSNLLVISLGSYMYIKGDITDIGIIAKFILYINMLIWPVTSIGWVSSLVQEAEASQKRINEFLKIEPEILNTTASKTLLNGSITFNHVTLEYPETGIKALDQISFSINKGETLAIIGQTGSGKSSILSLISRLYDPTSGTIKIDAQDLKNINLKQLREFIGFVPQDAFLFSDTIANNITFGKNNSTTEEITTASINAAVHENILDFKNGYETLLGERGISLSGGQKQRVSIARAIIKNPQILLLDDCLSAVDTETEEAILNNLKTICKGKTTIIVSHRVSSAKNADQIIVIDQGKITQQGTHNQLINQEGYYKELYLKQLTEKEML